MKHKVLIVEDERSILQQVDTLLESFGYESDFIPKANFMFKKLEKNSFDLILMDINMPGIDGIEALKMLKKHSEYKDIPVIMMTGDTKSETLNTCFQEGANDYITKPIEELVLKARVRSVLERQEYLEEIQKQTQKTLKSINYASTIQQAMLPSFTYFKQAFKDSFVLYKPRDIVSGDFYWFSEKNGKVFIATVDCTGHGVPGAFMSMLGSANLNHLINAQNMEDPASILDELHRNVRKALKQETTSNHDGMDISLCVIDKELRLLEYAGANSELMMFKKGKLERIAGDKRTIGGHKRQKEGPFNTHFIPLDSEVICYITTDGYHDQFGGDKGKKLMKKGFRQLLMDLQGVPLEAQKQRLDEYHELWKSKQPQTDDILVIGFKI